MLFRRLSGLLRPITQLAQHVPSQCTVCHAWPAQRVCNACVARFAQPSHRCTRCALVVPAGVLICGTCLKEPPAIDTCLAAVPYGYPWAQAIKAFKFHNDPGWAKPLATLLRSTPWIEPALEAADWVIPIPLSDQRLKERGFNQAALIAQKLAPTKTTPQAMLRLHDTTAQSGLTRAERLRNLRNAFMVEPHCAAALHGSHVILLDDVMTTGATLDAAASALRACSVKHITGVVVARTERE